MGLKQRIRDEVVRRYSVSRLYPIWPFTDISVDQGLEIHRVVSEALLWSSEKVLPEWDETFANLARVVLSERAQARAVDDFKLKST